MKKFFLLFAFCAFGISVSHAQLPPGSTAPNFTVTDLDGNTWTLYDLLDEGKTVYLDFSATWCGPCWNYHNTHALRDLWDTYGPPGTGEAFVFFIEGDANTNTACLYGPAGCVGGTQGNWVDGTPYPIVESHTVRGQYAVSYYPTIYMVCPANKKVYETGQQPMAGLWSKRETTCPPLVVNIAVNSIKNVKCFDTNTGSIDITPSSGNPPYTYIWSNGAQTQDLNNIPAGSYTCTVTSSNGWTGVTDPIEVEGPPGAIAIDITEQTPMGCNGIKASVTVEASGGWPGNFNYIWSNGQAGQTASNLSVGNYTVTVTDPGLCTKTLTANIAPAVLPTATIAPPQPITCIVPSFELNATGSSSGDNFSYQWFFANGGNIVSGATTLTPVIDAGGTYTLQVKNNNTNCISYASVIVTSNVALPNADAGPAGIVSCSQPTTVLQGSGSAGNNITYLWTASNGGNIASGANTLSPTVNAGGTYTLQVTNNANGCTKTSSTIVAGIVPPMIKTANGVFTCVADTVPLITTINSNNVTFVWIGPNGFTSNLQSPMISDTGVYKLVVADTLTGCTNTATVTAYINITPPDLLATGGALTCLVDSVTMNGISQDTTATFFWTGPLGFTSNLQNPVVGIGGEYIVVATSAINGCTSSANATVALNNIPPVASAITPGNLNCNTNQMQLNGTGSSQGVNISYFWTTSDGHIISGEATTTPLIDAVGTYHLLVSNSETGCLSTTSTAVILSPSVTATISAQTNVSCNSGSDGTATAIPGGGNNVYSYAWSNGANTATVSNLAAGTYFVTVTDGENCTTSTSLTITQPDPLIVDASATAQSINGVNDGTASAIPTGGAGNYTYAWSNGATTQTINGLAPGSYTVIVTDANGCMDVQTVTVNAFNCALSANISGTNVTCFGANNGTATVSLIGAVNPVSYTWSNGANTPSTTNLSSGNYMVNIVDGNNCPATLNIIINEPVILAANATSTHETAASANDGSATANPTGGTSNYTYLWSNGAANQTISNLAPGNYTVIVTDANGCTALQTVVVNVYNCAVSVQTSVAHVSCAGASNGSISLTISGGTAPFTYIWSNGETTPAISNLSGDIFTASVTDANGCQSVNSVAVNEPAPYSPWAVETTNPACPNDATGSATANISGGTAPYSFLWSNGATTNAINNLTVGNYGVTVTDQNECKSSTSVAITSQDNVPPTVSIQNATVSLNVTGIAEITLSALSAQIADNCSVASSSISPKTFDCSQIGQHQVFVTVTDQAGLTATATATVTIVDDFAPVVSCPSDIIRCADNNIVEYASPVATDNCLGNGGQWNLANGLPSGSEFPFGTTLQTWTYTDQGGNVGACSFTVRITESVVIGNTVVTNDVGNQSVGAINIAVGGGSLPYTFQWTKNGQFFGNTEDLSGLSEGYYSVVVIDANGCVVSQENIHVMNTVSSTEPAWLEGVRLQPNPTSGLTQIVFAQTLASLLEISVIDATGRVLLSNVSENQAVVTLDCSTLPQGMYALRFRTGTEIGIRKLVISR